jgi:hypothetical protein
VIRPIRSLVGVRRPAAILDGKCRCAGCLVAGAPPVGGKRQLADRRGERPDEDQFTGQPAARRNTEFGIVGWRVEVVVAVRLVVEDQGAALIEADFAVRRIGDRNRENDRGRMEIDRLNEESRAANRDLPIGR